MKNLKSFLRKFLLYCLKKLNMPKSFSELSNIDIQRIDSVLKGVLPLNLTNMSYFFDRDYVTIEYRRLSDISHDEYLKSLSNNPFMSLKIDNVFNIDVLGADLNDTTLIQLSIKGYLKVNGFL